MPTWQSRPLLPIHAVAPVMEEVMHAGQDTSALVARALRGPESHSAASLSAEGNFLESDTSESDQDAACCAAVDLTVIVPTFNEKANVAPLMDRLAQALGMCHAEIVFVDDSTDDTPQEIAAVAAAAQLPVHLIHREGASRTGGLAGAVTAGIQVSTGEYVLVMDGDLQHPPEMVPQLRDATGDVDLVVASRYAGVGDASGLSSSYRRLISSGSTLLAQTCFPRRVGRVCTDPMTGLFLLPPVRRRPVPAASAGLQDLTGDPRSARSTNS